MDANLSMTQRNDSGESFRAPWQVFWAAFGVRVLYLILAHTYRIQSAEPRPALTKVRGNRKIREFGTKPAVRQS
jgi:hypothetical protein